MFTNRLPKAGFHLIFSLPAHRPELTFLYQSGHKSSQQAKQATKDFFKAIYFPLLENCHNVRSSKNKILLSAEKLS